MEFDITTENTYRTIAKAKQSVQIDGTNDEKEIFLSTKVTTNLLFVASYKATYSDGQGTIVDLPLPDGKDYFERADFEIKAKELKSKHLNIIATITKIDPNGMELQENQLTNDSEVTLSCKLEAGNDLLLDQFDIKGQFPKEVSEVFRTFITFE